MTGLVAPGVHLWASYDEMPWEGLIGRTPQTPTLACSGIYPAAHVGSGCGRGGQTCGEGEE